MALLPDAPAASLLIQNAPGSKRLIGCVSLLAREVTALRNEDSHQGTAFGNCRNTDIAAGPRQNRTHARVADRAVPLGTLNASAQLTGLSNCALSAGVAKIKSTQAQ